MSDSVRPHRQHLTRLRRPWDSPGKNTGVGCHFLLQCMKVKSESEVAQSCPTLSDPMDCSLPGSSIHWIFQARVLEWGAIAFSGSTFYTTSIQCTLFLSLIYGSRWALGKRILLFCGIRVGFLSHRAVWSRLPALSKGKAQSEYGNKLTH